MFLGFVLGVIFTVLAAIGAGYMVVTNGVIDASAGAKPGLIEKWAAQNALQATMQQDAPKRANPVPLTDANLIAGIKLYGTHCAVCHGTAAGNRATPPIAKGENPKPPQLGGDGVEDDPEGITFWKIKNGIRWSGMPAWKDTLNDQQIWTLALFLKHMDKLPPGPNAAWQQVSVGEGTDLDAQPHRQPAKD